MNYSESTQQGHVDCHRVFCHSVHGGGEEGRLEGDAFCHG